MIYYMSYIILYLIKIVNLIEYLNVNRNLKQPKYQPQLGLVLGNQRQLFQLRLHWQNHSVLGQKTDSPIKSTSTIQRTVKAVTVILNMLLLAS